MILVSSIIAGILLGQIRARWVRGIWYPPELNRIWLVPLAYLPQILAIYLPVTRALLSEPLVSGCLVASQAILLVFCLLNLRLPGMSVLAAGLLLNLCVIVANGGFMPLGLDTAGRLIPPERLAQMEIGRPLGSGSKDILLEPGMIVLPQLADRFLPPAWFPYQFAFSAGDILISLGAFLLLGMSKVASSQRKVMSNAHESTG